MASTTDAAAPSDIRPPLTPNTNGSHPDLPTPYNTAKSKQSFTVRHEKSAQTFRTYLDSSESIPSAHDSIYEASVISSPSKENIPPIAPPAVEEGNPAGEEHTHGNLVTESSPEEERRMIERLAWLNYIDPVHTPHRLEPITEKTSLATLQTKASSILGHRPVTTKTSEATIQPTKKASTLPLRHAPSANEVIPLPTVRPRHRKSFSLPSFSSFRRSKLSSSSSAPASPTPFPNLPNLPPPERRPTPPGLPTFNTLAAINYRLPAPPARFRDHFRSQRLAEKEYRRQTTALPRGVVMRGENGELIRGRWRAGPSGHGTGSAHPWAPYSVRPEATTEMMRYPGGNERARVQQPAVPAVQGEVNSMTQNGGSEKSNAWWEKIAWFCCGVERDDDGEIRMSRVKPRRVTEPLFVGGTNAEVVA